MTSYRHGKKMWWYTETFYLTPADIPHNLWCNCFTTISLHPCTQIFFLCSAGKITQYLHLADWTLPFCWMAHNTVIIMLSLLLKVLCHKLYKSNIVLCFMLGNSPASEVCMPMPGNYAGESTQHSEHGKSLKSRNLTLYFVCKTSVISMHFVFFVSSNACTEQVA